MTILNRSKLYCVAIGLLLSPFLYGQCNSWDAHPKGAEAAKEQHVIYRDLQHQRKYQEAYTIWHQLFQYVQAPQQNKRRHFKDGIKFYKELAKATEKKALKASYIDTLVHLYQRMETCAGPSTSDLTWKGYDLYSLRGNPVAALQAFEKALELGGSESPDMLIVPMAQLTVYLFQKKQTNYDKDYVTKVYYQLKKLVDEQPASKAAKYKSKWEKAYLEFYKIKEQLPEIWGCSFYEDEFLPMYLSDSNDVDQNNTILARLQRICGAEGVLYNRILAHQQNIKDNYCWGIPIEKLSRYKQAACRESQAIRFLKNGDSTKYEQHLKESKALYAKCIEEKDTSLPDHKAAEIIYRMAYEKYLEGAYNEARKLCLDAIEYNPNFGAPYMLIGTLYVSSSKACSGGKDNWDSQTVIWPAMDIWELAMRMDPKVKEDAQAKIAKYKAYLPTIEAAFQRGLKEGDPYMVGCWIKQKTKVRVLKE